jgi:hypothetical protein
MRIWRNASFVFLVGLLVWAQPQLAGALEGCSISESQGSLAVGTCQTSCANYVPEACEPFCAWYETTYSEPVLCEVANSDCTEHVDPPPAASFYCQCLCWW